MAKSKRVDKLNAHRARLILMLRQMDAVLGGSAGTTSRI